MVYQAFRLASDKQGVSLPCPHSKLVELTDIYEEKIINRFDEYLINWSKRKH